jgi:putative phosphoribosyl transferase
MAKLVEDTAFRNITDVFEDRGHAGKLLAAELLAYKGTDSMVMAIPTGGVPVAVEIAETIDLPLDLLIVRKLQDPYNPEAGFGAASPNGTVIVNKTLVSQLGLTEQEIDRQVKKTMETIRKRNQLFRGGRPFPQVENKTVIIVDDGLASGHTMMAAIRFIKKAKPAKIVVAVPTGAKKTVDLVLPEVDEMVCLNIRGVAPFAVADAYANWYDLDDDEVLALLDNDHFLSDPAQE